MSGSKSRGQGKSNSRQPARRVARFHNSDDFDPDRSPLDYLTFRTVSRALQGSLLPPFTLRFKDSTNHVFREVRVTVKDDWVYEESVFLEPGTCLAPLTCTLTDSSSQTCETYISGKELEVFMRLHRSSESNEDGVVQIQFHSQMPNFSREAYLSVAKLLIGAALKDMQPPFTVEIRDARGQLFARREIRVSPEGEFEGGIDAVCCSHLPLPLTVKLVDQEGIGLVEQVKREQ